MKLGADTLQNPSGHSILGTVLLSVLLVGAPSYLSLLSPWADGPVFGWALVSVAIMAVIPFVLRAVAPKVADFDLTWLPLKRWHWAIVPVMLVVMYAGARAVVALALYLGAPFYHKSLVVFQTVTPAKIVLYELVAVVLGPIAEELFWRGYVLTQLRKVMPSVLALLIHAILFAISHFHLGVKVVIAVFPSGLILGTWRVRFRSLLPLILVHVAFNGLGSLLQLRELTVRLKPECQEIDLRTGEPAADAVPFILGFVSNPDEGVRNHAITQIVVRFGAHAEPCLKQALTSGNKDRVKAALDVIGLAPLENLRQEVRDVFFTADDLDVQLSALATMKQIGDTEGVQDILERHPNEGMRRAAKIMTERELLTHRGLSERGL